VSGAQSLVIFSTWNFVAIAVGTAVLASLIPYSLELVALRRLAPNAFSILISLEPGFAGLFGWILLAQNLSVLKISAIILVVMASILQTLSASTPAARRRVRSKAA